VHCKTTDFTDIIDSLPFFHDGKELTVRDIKLIIIQNILKQTRMP